MVYGLEKGKVCDESRCHFWFNVWQRRMPKLLGGERGRVTDYRRVMKTPEIILREIADKNIYPGEGNCASKHNLKTYLKKESITIVTVPRCC